MCFYHRLVKRLFFESSSFLRISPLPMYNGDKLGLQFSIMEIQLVVVYCVDVGH